MNDDEINFQTETQALHNIIEEAAGRRIMEANGVPCTVDRDGCVSIQEEMMAQPLRPRFNVILRSVSDLLHTIGAESAELGEEIVGRGYASLSGGHPRLQWIFDAWGPEGKLWGDMSAVLEPVRSKRFRAWEGSAGTWLAQTEFADFLEDHFDDIIGDNASKLLSISRNLEATSTSKFTSSQRPEIGDATLHWETETSTGDIVIPQEFQVGFPIFEHTDPYKLNLSLKLRVREGQARFMFKIKNIDQVILDILNDWIAQLDKAGRHFVIGAA